MFDYVAKEKVTSCQNLVFKLLRGVHSDLKAKDKITFKEKIIGSDKHHLVMSQHGGKDPFDFDINLIVSSSSKDLNANLMRAKFKNAIDKYFMQSGFYKSKNKTHVIRAVHHDENGNVDFSVDFAIYIHKGTPNSDKYMVSILNKGKFEWADITKGYKDQLQNEEYCKHNNLWQKVRETFKDKRNNDKQKKETRALYQETLKEVCDKAKATPKTNK